MKGHVSIDPASLMAIRDLELRARIVVEGYLTGLHRSPFHGFSVEFTEYRQYTPGDDPRYLDWKLYGRSDRHYIKRYEDETNVRCHLMVDLSRSMNFGSTGYPKSRYAGTLAATLACFLSRQGDAFGLLAFDDKIRDYLPPRNRRGHLRRLMLALERPEEGKGTDLEQPFQRLAELARKRGVIVIISDLLAPPDVLERHLMSLSASGHELLVFQVLDPREQDFGFQEPARFQDIEGGRELLIDPASAREGYLGKLKEHLTRIEELCRRWGIGYHRLTTDQPLDRALYEFLRSRNQGARRSKRSMARRLRAR